MASIGESIEAASAYLTEHPDEARYVDSTADAVLEGGLRARVDGPGGESVTTDMPSSVGGGASAPSPGWLFRAALASCVTSLIAMRASHQGVELMGLRVTVDGESDDRGILGIDPGVPAGPLSMRVRVQADAPRAEPVQVRAIVDWGIQHCPVFDAVRRAVEVAIER